MVDLENVPQYPEHELLMTHTVLLIDNGQQIMNEVDEEIQVQVPVASQYYLQLCLINSVEDRTYLLMIAICLFDDSLLVTSGYVLKSFILLYFSSMTSLMAGI